VPWLASVGMDGSFFAEEGRRVKHPAAADRSVPVVGRSRHRRGHHRHYVQNPVVDVTQKRLISARLLNTWTGVRKEIVCDNRDTRAESRRGFGTPAGFAGCSISIETVIRPAAWAAPPAPAGGDRRAK